MMSKQSITIFLILISYSLYSQTFYINEDFNSSSLPSGWTNTAVSGAASWSFGLDGSSDHGGNNNLDGTSFAFFDDSNLGASSIKNRASLTTPVFNSSIGGSTILQFDYNFRHFGASVLDSFYVEVFDGANWNIVFSRNYDDCGNYSACANYSQAIIDISAYKNAACQVRFVYFDGNAWSWYVGIDNVSISGTLVGINEKLNLKDISIYPNPSTGIFSIKSNLESQKRYLMQVRDIKGQLVYSKEVNNLSNFKLDLSGQSKGVYFLQIRSKQGILNEKIVIQ